jgi:predicted phosphodiesterase
MRIFFWPDTHTPFQDKHAVATALKILIQYKPDILVILGDFFDCYIASSFEKDPLKSANLIDVELRQGRKLLNEIITASKAKKVYFLEGNHELRIKTLVKRNLGIFANYFQINAPLGPEKMFGLPKGTIFLPYGQKQLFKLGPIGARHKTFQNQYVCGKTIQRSAMTMVFGHTHRVQYQVTTTIDGKLQAALSCGWLGNALIAGEYMDIEPEWAQAVATCEVYQNYFNLNPILIKNGKALYNGRYFAFKK